MDVTSGKRNIDLGAMRAPYKSEDIEQYFSSKDPLKLFELWFNNARNTDGIHEANAMAVATADKFGKPSVRYVLLKDFGKEGFTFYTNYNSRKGQEIAENPNVALLFYWESLSRQIRIEGSISKVPEDVSESYFHSRPKSSQVSSALSHQSEVIESKEVLLKRKQELENEFADSPNIPRPKCWGGYLVVPDTFEFWSGHSDRLHDRIRFRRKKLSSEIPDQKLTHIGEDGWLYEYLSP